MLKQCSDKRVTYPDNSFCFRSKIESLNALAPSVPTSLEDIAGEWELVFSTVPHGIFRSSPFFLAIQEAFAAGGEPEKANLFFKLHELQVMSWGASKIGRVAQVNLGAFYTWSFILPRFQLFYLMEWTFCYGIHFSWEMRECEKEIRKWKEKERRKEVRKKRRREEEEKQSREQWSDDDGRSVRVKQNEDSGDASITNVMSRLMLISVAKRRIELNREDLSRNERCDIKLY